MIQNYDTNGLIHLLNFDSAKTNEERYKKAVLNILDAQKFSCIPLVDGLRERSNTNNLKDRATYENGGDVTHIARKGIYEGEDEIVIIPISDINHIPEDSDLIEGLLQLFQLRNDEICDFIITVGGTSKQPIALFTLNELKNPNTKEHLFRRMAYHGISIGKLEGKKLSTVAKDVYDNLEIIDSKKSSQNIKPILKEITKDLAKIPKYVDKYNLRGSSLIDSGNFADLAIKDVMQMVTCGVENTDDKKVVEVARRLLHRANNFTKPAVYENGILNVNKIYNQSRTETSDAKNVKATDSLRDLIMSFDKNQINNDVFVIVEPDPEILTGEGKMQYPGCITSKELFSAKALLSYAASCVMIESCIRERLSNHLPKVENKVQYITVGEEQKEYELEKVTLGQMINHIKYSNLIKHIFPQVKEQITWGELDTLNATRIELVHKALVKCFGKKEHLAYATTENIQLIFRIGECLKIYD